MPIDMTAALDDLKAELQAGTEPAKALAYVAGEYGAKEDVLRARFERGTGKTVQAFAEVKIVARDLLAEAEKKARDWSARCELPEWQKRTIGKPFWWKNEKHLFAGYVKGKYGLRGVDVQTGRSWSMCGAAADKIVAELHAGAYA